MALQPQAEGAERSPPAFPTGSPSPTDGGSTPIGRNGPRHLPPRPVRRRAGACVDHPCRTGLLGGVCGTPISAPPPAARMRRATPAAGSISVSRPGNPSRSTSLPAAASGRRAPGSTWRDSMSAHACPHACVPALPRGCRARGRPHVHGAAALLRATRVTGTPPSVRQRLQRFSMPSIRTMPGTLLMSACTRTGASRLPRARMKTKPRMSPPTTPCPIAAANAAAGSP
jgi:hypothetical protein